MPVGDEDAGFSGGPGYTKPTTRGSMFTPPGMFVIMCGLSTRSIANLALGAASSSVIGASWVVEVSLILLGRSTVVTIVSVWRS